MIEIVVRPEGHKTKGTLHGQRPDQSGGDNHGGNVLREITLVNRLAQQPRHKQHARRAVQHEGVGEGHSSTP